jgi:hypothetical protein
MKARLIFCFLFIITVCVTGQTLIGIKTGINLTDYRDTKIDETFYGTPSYAFGVDIKGRKDKGRSTAIHIGTSVEYLRNSFNWNGPNNSGALGDQTSSGLNVHYTVEWLRLSLYPELVWGRRFQVNFNFSPFVSFKIHASKNGTSWTTDAQGRTTTQIETGSAADDFYKIDVGFREELGFSYKVLPWLALSLEENYSLGIATVNKVTEEFLKTKSLCVFFCTSFIIPTKKLKNAGKENHPPRQSTN